jgi:hypothetical protein
MGFFEFFNVLGRYLEGYKKGELLRGLRGKSTPLVVGTPL